MSAHPIPHQAPVCLIEVPGGWEFCARRVGRARIGLWLVVCPPPWEPQQVRLDTPVGLLGMPATSTIDEIRKRAQHIVDTVTAR